MTAQRHTIEPAVKAAAQRRELTPKEVAQYTADMMLEFRQLAKSVELTTIQSLIELVYYEAFATANPVDIPPEERARLRDMEVAGRKIAGTT